MRMLVYAAVIGIMFPLLAFSHARAQAPDSITEFPPDQQLVIAAFQLEVKRVESLLNAGADPNARLGTYNKSIFQDKWQLGLSPYGSEKWTPLLAVANSHRAPQPENETENTLDALKKAKELLNNIDPKIIRERDKKRLEIAKLLMSKNTLLDLDDGYGATALDSSIYNEYDSLSLFLIKSGANPNTKTDIYIDGTREITPLHRATSSPAVLKALIKHGAKVNVKDSSGWTPLHWAVRECNVESVQLLLGAGIDVNVKDKEGWTALDYARTSDDLVEFMNSEEKKQHKVKNKIFKLLNDTNAKK